MLLYLIVVLVLLGLIIGISFLIVQRRVPPYEAPPVEKKDALNDLGYLKETVKKKQEPQNDEQAAQEEENDEAGTAQEEETQEEQKQQKNKNKKNYSSTGRKKVEKKKINIRDAMIGKNILDKK